MAGGPVARRVDFGLLTLLHKEIPMFSRMNRRQFLGHSASAAALLSGVPISVLNAADDKSPNEKLNIACVGAGNKGWHNIEQLKSQNIVALCDVDTKYLDRAAQQFPKAAQYRD